MNVIRIICVSRVIVTPANVLGSCVIQLLLRLNLGVRYNERCANKQDKDIVFLESQHVNYGLCNIAIHTRLK